MTISVIVNGGFIRLPKFHGGETLQATTYLLEFAE
jgi:hypothetical protein